MLVCSGYDYRQRGATLVYKYMLLASIFSPDLSDSFPLLHVPAEPLSLPRLCSARSKLCPPSHHTLQDPLATAIRKAPPSTISGNTYEQNWDSHTVPSARPSIGIQSLIRTLSPQIPSSGQSASYHLPACEDMLSRFFSPPLVLRVQLSSRNSPTPPMTKLSPCFLLNRLWYWQSIL